jgi:hypothetical protein
MADLAFPLINGVRHDWTSVEVKLAGQIFIGAKSFNHSRKRTRGLVRGTHPDPLAKTRGTNEYAASVEMPLAEWQLFKALLVATAATLGIGYGDVLFSVTAMYSSPGFDTITVEALGCSCDSVDAPDTQSPDPLMRKIDLAPLKILDDGDDDTTPLQAPPTA